MQYIIDEQEVLEILTQEMPTLEEGNVTQHRCNRETYQNCLKKDSCAGFTMLSSMHNDLIGEFEEHATACAMQDALKFKFGGTSAIILHDLNIRFNSYKMRPNHIMKQHLRMMSTMIHKLNAAGTNMTEEQKIQEGIRSLPESWETMVISITHNEHIKTFDDLSCHLELEAELLKASKATKSTRPESAYVADNDSHVLKGSKHKNYAPRRDLSNVLAPNKAKNTKCKRDKRGGKGKNGKYFNSNKQGHFVMPVGYFKGIMGFSTL